VNERQRQRDELQYAVAALIDRLADGSRDDQARDALLQRVLAWQRTHVVAYGRIANGAGAQDESLLSAPAVPTDVFRFARVAAHEPALDTRVFRTSGTSGQPRGAHHLRDLSLYERAARAAATWALFPDTSPPGPASASIQLCVLAPRDRPTGNSSLSFMLSKFDAWYGHTQSVFAWHGDGPQGQLDVEALVSSLARAQQSGEPLALLGTSFAFVHADDALGSRRFCLPEGSRVMQTGGFKGRTREVQPQAMRSMLAARYGVDEAAVIAEYGMTELSSQMYETTLRDRLAAALPTARRLWVPGWVRATPVDPDTLQEVPVGEVGILRIDDLANLDTACAIQTSDRARRVGDGIELLGRLAGATPRGCSLAVDAALGGSVA